MSHRCPLRATLRAAAACALLAISVPAGEFQAGDLYLHTVGAGPLFGSHGGLIRIDPLSGQVDGVLTYTAGSPVISHCMAYDPYRDRLILKAAIGSVSEHVWAVDANGGLTDMGVPSSSFDNFAPRGDGIIYMRLSPPTTKSISYFDANGVVHQLKDSAGSADYLIGGPGAGADYRGMIYHPGTNALFVAWPSFGNSCGAVGVAKVAVRKIPLSADGTKVAGAESCLEFDVDVGGVGEVPVGFSHGPNGNLMLCVDTNSNAQQPRMILIDPVAFTATAWASSGAFTGAAAVMSGTFSKLLGRAVIADYSVGRFRTYGFGETGAGSFLPVATLIFGDRGTLVEIGTSAPNSGLTANVGAVSIAAGGTQVLTYSGDAALAGAGRILLGSFSGWSPGVGWTGFTVPLNPDVYTTLTLQHPNDFFLPDSLGLLDGNGDAVMHFTWIAGFKPALVGTVFHHALLVFDGGGNLLAVSNPVAAELVP